MDDLKGKVSGHFEDLKARSSRAQAFCHPSRLEADLKRIGIMKVPCCSSLRSRKDLRKDLQFARYFGAFCPEAMAGLADAYGSILSAMGFGWVFVF